MWELSKQAWTILAVYAICTIVFVISILSTKMFGWGWLAAIFMILFSVGYTALITYDTNCLTKGYCGVWSWIRTVLYIIFPVISLITMLIAFVFSPREKETTNESDTFIV